MTVVKTLIRKYLRGPSLLCKGKIVTCLANSRNSVVQFILIKTSKFRIEKNWRDDIGHLMKTFKRVYSAK